MSPIPCRIVALSALLALSACNQTSRPVASAQAPASPSNVTSSSFRMPDGAGCTGAVNRYRAIINNDLETGHTTKTVHAQVSQEIDAAAQLCASGNDGGARAAVTASRSRHGYPAG